MYIVYFSSANSEIRTWYQGGGVRWCSNGAEVGIEVTNTREGVSMFEGQDVDVLTFMKGWMRLVKQVSTAVPITLGMLVSE